MLIQKIVSRDFSLQLGILRRPWAPNPRRWGREAFEGTISKGSTLGLGQNSEMILMIYVVQVSELVESFLILQPGSKKKT